MVRSPRASASEGHRWSPSSTAISRRLALDEARTTPLRSLAMGPTIHFDAQVIGPEEFEVRSARSAAAMRERGVGPGDVVALILHNEPVLLELIMASRRLGARWWLINWHVKASEVRHILSDSDAKVFVRRV